MNARVGCRNGLLRARRGLLGAEASEMELAKEEDMTNMMLPIVFDLV
jgi:hypothetical protein